MRAAIASWAGMALLVGLFIPCVQAAEFWQTTLVTDPEDDYPLNGALDITAVHVSEVFRYDLVKRTGLNVVQFHIMLRSRDDIGAFKGEVPVDFTLNFTANGVKRSINVTMTQHCPLNIPSKENPTPGPDCTKNDPVVAAPHYTDASGITLVFDAVRSYLLPTVTIEGVYVTSGTLGSDGRKTYQDQAPHDNQGQPEGDKITAPATPSASMKLQGPYPFLRIAPQTPTERFAVPGGEATFSVEFRVDPNLKGIDRILVDFKAPSAWTIDSNLAREIALTETSRTASFTFTVNVPRGLDAGLRQDILLDAVLPKNGGHATLRTYVTVSGPRVDMPEYDFQLLTKGPFQAGATVPVKFLITERGAPLAPSNVRIDFVQGGKVQSAATLQSKGAGNYETTFDFPVAGTWTLDPHIAEFTPAPHETFEVTVEGDGGEAPGAPAWALLGLAGALAVWRRRLP